MTRLQSVAENIKNRIKDFIKNKFDNRRAKKEFQKSVKLQEFVDQQYPALENPPISKKGIKAYDVVELEQDFPGKELFQGYKCTVENIYASNSGEISLLVLYDEENSQGELVMISDVVPEWAVKKYWDCDTKTLVNITDTANLNSGDLTKKQ